MNPFTAIIKEAARRKSSKKKRAAGISAGALTGGAVGAPAGLLAAMALMALKPKIHRIAVPKGPLKQLRYFRKGGLKRDLALATEAAKRRAIIGGSIGAGGGALMGGLAGHELAKQGAAIASRLTPKSSNVRGFSYDPKSQDLVVTYKSGGTYRYRKVPPAVATALRRNKSVGKTIHRRVKKPGFEYEKVSSPFVRMVGNLGVPRRLAGVTKKTQAKAWYRRAARKFHPDLGGDPQKFQRLQSFWSSYQPTFNKLSASEMLAKEANDPIKETVKVHGIPVALEWRKGETRKYFNHDPLKRKSTGSIDYNQKMKVDYGYVKGVIDADGEELDVYLGPDRESEKVFVLEKLRKTDSSFDENKVMLGYGTKDEARKSYLQHQGSDELGKIIELTVPAFKARFMRKNKFKKHGSGDMIEYFNQHPKKYREWQERREAKKRRKGSASQRFVQSRTPGGLKKKASLEEKVAYRMVLKRRAIAKLAGAAKKTVTWNGIVMKLEYLTGDTRSGINGTSGEKWSRTMKDNYGYLPGTKGKGADGDALDIYLAPEPVEGPVFKVSQKKHDGAYDEDKFMIGYGSAAAAKKAFLRNMPSWAFGKMVSMSHGRFVSLAGQTRVSSEAA